MQKPESIAYFYIEVPSQIRVLYEVCRNESEQIELQLHLRDREEVQIVSGVPKPEAPPFQNPPFHLKVHFPFEMLSFADDVG